MRGDSNCNGLKSLFESSTPTELSRIHNGHAFCVSFEQMLGALSEGRVLAVAGGRMFSAREKHIRANGKTRSSSHMNESRSNTDKTKRKPWLTPVQQVEHLKRKGVRFEKISEENARTYLGTFGKASRARLSRLGLYGTGVIQDDRASQETKEKAVEEMGSCGTAGE